MRFRQHTPHFPHASFILTCTSSLTSNAPQSLRTMPWSLSAQITYDGNILILQFRFGNFIWSFLTQLNRRRPPPPNALYIILTFSVPIEQAGCSRYINPPAVSQTER